MVSLKADLVLATVACLTTLALASYSNVTLTSYDGSLEVVVYLPVGIKPTEKTYYVSSRFDHGSMIGSIKRTSRKVVSDEIVEQEHYLFGGEQWRTPHNSQWPESGIGLASEFGVGDDGAYCQYRCGWEEVDDVTNGVLGYREARNGEPFLKIGVGALIKGSCPSCDSTDNYRFNSPYEFAELPQWHVLQATKNILAIEHEASLKHHGYRLHKDIVLDNNVLLVTSVLTNLGSKAFSTAWYSHNFFTCDGIPIREGYGLDLNIRGQRGTLYEEPGVIGSWAVPLQAFASVKEYPGHVEVDVYRPLEGGTRIKAEFVNDGSSDGGFVLHGCDTSIRNEFPDVQRGVLPMYAYNLYLEKGTFSPEPQLLIHLEPGASTSWTQRIVFEDDADDPTMSQRREIFGLRMISLTDLSPEDAWKLLPAMVIVVLAVSSLFISSRSSRNSRRLFYSQIPDVN